MTASVSQGAVLCAASIAGGAGASLRLIVDGVVRSLAGGRLPWGTLLINVSGSFALGALLGAEPSAPVATVVGTGLLGGFTTFSTASFETAVLVLERRRLAGLAYAAGTLVTAVAAAATGYAATS
jgi:CrcB protein